MSQPHGPYLTIEPGQWNDLQKRICDGIAEDIDENAGLPEHTTVKYRRPRLVLPSDCPLLTVTLIDEDYQSTGGWRLEEGITVGIVWQEPAIEELKTLVDSPELSVDLLRAISQIKTRVRWMSGLMGTPSHGQHLPGVPELDAMFPVRTDYVPPAETVDTGAVEGYAMTVRVFVRE